VLSVLIQDRKIFPVLKKFLAPRPHNLLPLHPPNNAYFQYSAASKIRNSSLQGRKITIYHLLNAGFLFALEFSPKHYFAKPRNFPKLPALDPISKPKSCPAPAKTP